MLRRIAAVICGCALGLLVVAGCEDDNRTPVSVEKPKKKVEAPPPTSGGTQVTSIVSTTKKRPQDTGPTPSSPSHGSDPSPWNNPPTVSGSGPVSGAIHNDRWAVDRVTSEIALAAKARKTLVVWLLDEGNNSSSLRQDVAPLVKAAYPGLVKNAGGDKSEQLLTAVVGLSSPVEYATEQPTADPAQVTSAIDRIAGGGKDIEIYPAITQVVEKYAPLIKSQNRDVLFVLVSFGGDGSLTGIDDTVAALKKNSIPVFAITKPAPVAGDSKVRETLYQESIDLEFMSQEGDSGLDDANFGPFGVCRLASPKTVEGGGVLLIQGPSAADPSVMKKYAPDYVSEKDYGALMASNKARKALFEASKIPHVKTFSVSYNAKNGDYPEIQFLRILGNEAALAKNISNAQRAGALLEQNINKLFDTLNAGVADRTKLPPRLQAEFDLALGRAMAAKARCDGYNAMLAVIKQGKPFVDTNHSRWILKVDDEGMEAGSVIANMSKKARTLMEGVVRDHKGTPWATIAEHELTEHYGWKWYEE